VKGSTKDADVTSEAAEEFEKTKWNLHLKRFEFTNPAPDTVTTLPPETGPEVGTTALKTALKLTGVNGTIEKFPLIVPGGAAGQQIVFEGWDTEIEPP
jgi:hypothetical protein